MDLYHCHWRMMVFHLSENNALVYNSIANNLYVLGMKIYNDR